MGSVGVGGEHGGIKLARVVQLVLMCTLQIAK